MPQFPLLHEGLHTFGQSGILPMISCDSGQVEENLIVSAAMANGHESEVELTPEEQLGRSIFFDEKLSGQRANSRRSNIRRITA